ncbi:hypothetical protein D3C73_779180 [compost metagenome]
MGDADVTNAPLFLPLAQGRQVGFPVQQVVDLHQVDAIGLQQPEGLLHLCDALLTPASPHLGGQERWRARLVDRQQLAGGLLGAAIHGRAVDHRPALLEQRTEHPRQLSVGGIGRRHIKTAIGAHADHRQGFVAGRNGAGQHVLASCFLRRRGGRQGRIESKHRRRSGSQREQSSARESIRVVHGLPLRSTTLAPTENTALWTRAINATH